jgi:hypothetical protein
MWYARRNFDTISILWSLMDFVVGVAGTTQATN